MIKHKSVIKYHVYNIICVRKIISLKKNIYIYKQCSTFVQKWRRSHWTSARTAYGLSIGPSWHRRHGDTLRSLDARAEYRCTAGCWDPKSWYLRPRRLFRCDVCAFFFFIEAWEFVVKPMPQSSNKTWWVWSHSERVDLWHGILLMSAAHSTYPSDVFWRRVLPNGDGTVCTCKYLLIDVWI